MARVGRGLVAMAAAGVLVAGLGACTGGGGSEMPGLTASPSPTPTATPTPTPTAEEFTDELGVVFDFSDPDLQLVFEDVPRDLTGDAADVHNAMALWTRESWRSITTNEVSPYLYEASSADALKAVEDDVALNVENGNTVGGPHRVTISDVVVNGESATGVACRDYTDGTFVNANGSHDPADVGFGEPFAITYTLLNRGGGVWWIESVIKDGTC